MQVLYYILAVFIILNLYFLKKYRASDLEIEEISLQSNINIEELLVYALPEAASEIDFTHPLKATRNKDRITFAPASLKARTFRIYLSNATSKSYIKDIAIKQNGINKNISPKEFKLENIFVNGSVYNNLIIFSNKGNGYLQFKKETVTFKEILITELIILFVSILISFLLQSLFKFQIAPYFKLDNLQAISVVLFISSIFLPHPIFNITFMASCVLVIKDFSFSGFLKNKIGLIIFVYFLIILMNGLFISESINIKFIETSLSLFFLPLYFSNLPKQNYLKLFPLTAILLSLFFIFTSLIDTFIYTNINYLSFDNFTKYIHPIYFSYLLFFSLIYMLLRPTEFTNNTILLSIIAVALICCGSKLIISAALLFYLGFAFKKHILTGSIALLILISSLFIFSPIKNRFKEIINPHSLSVLSENPIKTKDDPRLTGVTLRLILWQETFSSISSLKNVLFGQGFDAHADKILEDRLNKRGLPEGHTKYDPHNQFIASLFKTGLFGLATLVFLCIFIFFKSFILKNKLLFFSGCLFFLAMLTESVLQRALGLYFFCTILILQFNQLQTIDEN